MKTIPVLHTSCVNWSFPDWTGPTSYFEWVYRVEKPVNFFNKHISYRRLFLYLYDFGYTETHEHIRDCEVYVDHTFTDKVRYLALGYTPLW